MEKECGYMCGWCLYTEMSMTCLDTGVVDITMWICGWGCLGMTIDIWSMIVDDGGTVCRIISGPGTVGI